jgi:hypothetical protein
MLHSAGYALKDFVSWSARSARDLWYGALDLIPGGTSGEPSHGYGDSDDSLITAIAGGVSMGIIYGVIGTTLSIWIVGTAVPGILVGVMVGTYVFVREWDVTSEENS